MSFWKRAFYVKNVPNGERVVRVLAASALVGYALGWLAAPWSFVVAGSAAGFALTGLVGFCPACALVGRRLRAPQ
jgi:hypothetical protein